MPDVIFVVMNLTDECVKERIISRHGTENPQLTALYNKLYSYFEPATEDEENAYNITIDCNDSREDVIEKVLGLFKDNDVDKVSKVVKENKESAVDNESTNDNESNVDNESPEDKDSTVDKDDSSCCTLS